LVRNIVLGAIRPQIWANDNLPKDYLELQQKRPYLEVGQQSQKDMTGAGDGFGINDDRHFNLPI
jgi:hypothetical protein